MNEMKHSQEDDYYYKIDIYCRNCEFSNKEISVSRGMSLSVAKCPKCGCATLRKFNDREAINK